MTTTLKNKLEKLSVTRRNKINKRAAELIAIEATLPDLRKALELTQADVSAKLHINQEAVSRLERRSDLMLSTLDSYIRAMGGKLSLTAKFPNKPLIKLHGFGDIEHRKAR